MSIVSRIETDSNMALKDLILDELTSISRDAKKNNFKEPHAVLENMIKIDRILNGYNGNANASELSLEECYTQISVYINQFINSRTSISKKADGLSNNQLQEINEILNEIRSSNIKEKLPQYEKLN